VKELKDICATYHSPRSGRKSDLISRIVTHLSSLSEVEGETLFVETEVENENFQNDVIVDTDN